MTQQRAEQISIQGPRGFVAGGVKAGLKPSGALDLAAILSDRPAVAAGVTTQNRFPGAPVVVVRERLASGRPMRGIMINAGISNVCTGERGIEDARAMTRMAAAAAGCEAEEFLVASTGVIGVPLPMQKIADAVPRLMNSLSTDGWDTFSRAIMTTDLLQKVSWREVKLGGGKTATVLGICKGSGMIEPHMATMLAFIVTDYPLTPELAGAMLRRVADQTFNRVTVDGDTSTSDMAILFSNGAAVNGGDEAHGCDDLFEAGLFYVCEDLARAIARDGEGATHLVTVEVSGAESDSEALRIAKTIANSPLVKTAIFGRDPNWGRICAAAGRAGVAFQPSQVSLRLQGILIFEGGMPLPFDRNALRAALEAPDTSIQLKIGEGPRQSRVWTCDLTYDYVKINAEYTT